MARIISDNGGIRSGGTTTENEPIIKSDGASSDVMEWQSSDENSSVKITEDASNNLDLVVSTGNVGIGGSPTNKLSIEDTTGIVGMNIKAATDNLAYIDFGNSVDSNIGGINYNNADDTLNLRAGNANRLTISIAGDVTQAAGVFTKTGTNGNFTIDSYGQTLNLTRNGSNYLYANAGSSASFQIQAQNNIKLSTGVGQTPRLTIDNAGAVTIPGAVTIGSLDIGHGAGGGDTNTAVGTDALDGTHASSLNNTGIGKDALGALTGSSAHSNTAVGTNCLDGTASGADNTAIGAGALSSACVNDNVAVGRSALNAFTGSNATAVGSNALLASVSDVAVTAVGHNALANCNGGDYNTAVGKSALLTVDGNHNTAVGYASLNADCVSDNTAVGKEALKVFTGSNAVAVGSGAADAATSATFLTAIGKNAAGGLLTGAGNTAIGYQSLMFADGTEARNVALGALAARFCDGTNDCIAIGYGAMSGANIGGDASGDTANATKPSGDSNIAIGNYALDAATTATQNVAIGHNSLTAGTASFSQNTAVGWTTGSALSGRFNTMLGSAAMRYGTSHEHCVAIGLSALSGDGTTAPTGHYNVAIGSYALDATTTGERNIGIGTNALGSESSGADYCVAIGDSALALQDANVKNTAIGGLAGDNIQGGDGNTLLGFKAGSNISTTNDNTAVGHMAYAKGTGANNTCLGWGAGSSAVDTGTALSGSDNVIVGYGAGYDLTDGPGNVLVGKSAGANMTTGDYNVAIGYQAADAMVVACNYNIAIGYNALGGQATSQEAGSTFGNPCIAIGKNALLVQDDADANNLAIGTEAGDAITSGTRNVLIGHQAGSAIVDDDDCTALGYAALSGSTAGDYNTAIGSNAMQGAITGDYNTALGSYALGFASGGMASNTAIGTSALHNLNHANADNNVAVGFNAGRQTIDATPANVTQASQSVFIGAGTESADIDKANEIVIGYGGQGQGSNTIQLGNASISALHCAVTTITSDSRVKRDVASSDIGLGFIEKLQSVTFKAVNPADYPDEIKENRLRDTTREELVSKAVEAADEVWEEVVVQEARDAVAEETREEVHAAVEEVTEEVTIPAEEAEYEDRVAQEAREEVKGERHKHTEREVTETVTREEIVEVDGKWVKKQISEEVTRTERTPVYEECDLYDEDGSICTHCVTPAIEAKDAVVDEDGSEIEPAVEAVAEVTEPVKHKVAVMEEYIVQEACDEVTERVCVKEAVAERTETRVVVEAQDEWTETHIVTPAEPAHEEVKERRLVSAAVEAKDAVYETVTVPADDRPDDDDTVRLGLIAQDVQTAMTEAGVEFDIVNESPNGKLSLKYGNLVMPLIKAVQELSARVKTLEG